MDKAEVKQQIEEKKLGQVKSYLMQQMGLTEDELCEVIKRGGIDDNEDTESDSDDEEEGGEIGKGGVIDLLLERQATETVGAGCEETPEPERKALEGKKLSELVDLAKAAGVAAAALVPLCECIATIHTLSAWSSISRRLTGAERRIGRQAWKIGRFRMPGRV